MSDDHWTSGGPEQQPLVAVIGLPAHPDWNWWPAASRPGARPPVLCVIRAGTAEALAAARLQVGRPERLTVLILPDELARSEQTGPDLAVIAVDGNEQAALAARTLLAPLLSAGYIGIGIVDVVPVLAGRRFRLAGP